MRYGIWDMGHRTQRPGTYALCLMPCKDLGRPSAGVPPLPIPNREVKPCRADGTGVTPGRVGRRPNPYSPPPQAAGLFFFLSSSPDKWNQPPRHGHKALWAVGRGLLYEVSEFVQPRQPREKCGDIESKGLNDP